jgi:hypothetical protein
MTRARRVDANQADIVDALRSVGCWVDVTSGLGCGFADLVVARNDGLVFLVEVKLASGGLTRDEVEYIVRRIIPSYRIFTTAENAVKGILEAK